MCALRGPTPSPPAFAAQVMRDELAARVGTEMDAIQQAVGVAAEEEEAEGEEGDAPADGGVQFEGLSYDQLLELGDRMGDVARERWVRAAPAYIKTLKQYVQGPTPAANAHLPLAEGLNPLGDSADRCVACSILFVPPAHDLPPPSPDPAMLSCSPQVSRVPV